MWQTYIFGMHWKHQGKMYYDELSAESQDEAAGYCVDHCRDDVTRQVIARVCGGTLWQGKAAMRVSVSSWATTDQDVSKSIEAILRIAADAKAHA
jgi:hypothetical protein